MRSFRTGRTLALHLAACLAATALGVAQETVPPQYVELGPAEIHPPGNDFDIPPPPRQILATPALPSHGVPRVPVGAANGIPEPNSPPITGIAAPGAPCDLRYFVNRIVDPGGNTSTIAEPSAACNRDTGFFTWNWGAALSQDSGMSWSYVNPYTKFSAIDGGFCCDQRTLHVDSPEMTLWYLQYSKSTTTQLGHIRLAIAPDRASLAGNSWHSYTFAPDNFGFGTGEWLDFPDIAVTNEHVYCASNIFSVANDAYVSSVVWKLNLQSIKAGGIIGAWYWTRANLGGSGSYRLTQGASTQMYLAAHNTTSQLRVARNFDTPSNSAMTLSDVNVGSWSGGSMVATAPNGQNWAGRADNRITGAYATTAEYGFMWHIGRRPANGRDQAYVRVARLAVINNALFNEQDIYNSTWAFLYPAANRNAAGEPAYTCAFGSADGDVNGRHPTNFYRIVDPNDCGVNFGGGSISVPFSGGSSPTSPVWGDYFTLQRSNNQTNTFVATGMARDSSGQQQPRYIWFGKEEDTPVTPALQVSSDPATITVPVTVAHTDLDNRQNGSTPFTRRYPQSARYELTAPASLTSGTDTWFFCNWRYRVSGSSAWVNHPLGQRTLSVDSIGGSDDSAQCVYAVHTTITVDDRNVAGGVTITVVPADLDSQTNGVTSFTRRYKASTNAIFAAPTTVGNQAFHRWFINGVAQPVGDNLASVTGQGATASLIAEYCTFTQGTYSTYGTGCAGSNGQIPSHTSSSTPQIGSQVTHNVSGLRGPTPAVMFLGFSKTLWNGFPLPLSLGFIGANPSCNVLVDGFLQLPITINGAGAGSRTFIVTSDPSAIGMHTYTQVIAADLFLPDPIPLVVSNGLDMLIGGGRCP